MTRAAKGLHLDPFDRTVLTAWTRARRLPYGQVRRALAVLRVAEGHSIRSVARLLGVAPRHVHHWITRFRAEGHTALLLDADRRRRARKEGLCSDAS